MKRFLSTFETTDAASIECLNALNAGLFGDAVASIQSRCREGYKNFALFQLLAAAHILAHRPDCALLALDKALQIDSDCPNSYYLAGRARVMMGEYKLAFIDFSRAIVLDRCHCDALFYRAWLLFCNECFDEAIQDYSSSLESLPSNATAYHQRGLCFEQLNKPEDALADFSRAIQLDPSQPDYVFSRGLILASEGKFAAAITDYSQAIALDPGHSEAYYSRALLCDELDAYDLALVDYSKAIEIDPNHGEAFYCRGCIYGKLALNDLSLNDLSRAISLDDQHLEAFIARGRLYSSLELYAEAAKDFGNAISICPLPETLRERASCFQSLGDDTMAFSEFSRSLVLSAAQEK